MATTRMKDEVTEEWGDAEVEVSGFAIVKPNGALKKLLAAEPIIDEQNPATLTVIWSTVSGMGSRLLRSTLKCSAFVEDSEAFALDF